jgi:predicted transcriptional regulator
MSPGVSPGVSTVLRIGPLELAVLTVLWDAAQPMPVRAVREQMGYPQEVAYTTVATVLANLCFKGHVGRTNDRHRWYYSAAQSREEYLAGCIRVLLAGAADPAAVLAPAARVPGQEDS